MQPIDDFMEEVNEYIRGRNFDSLEDLNAALAEFSERTNRQRHQSFAGLSPDHIHNMLYRPFDGTGEILTLNRELDTDLVRATPIMEDARIVLEHFAERKTVRATAKGFLARASAQALHVVLAKEPIEQRFLPQSEENSGSVHWFRLLLQRIGWIKLRKGRFSLTKAGELIVESGIAAKHYHKLLRFYGTRFNWAFRDAYPQIEIIQSGFLFALFLARRNAETLASVDELAGRFLQAFPLAISDIPPTPLHQPEEIFQAAFRLRFVHRFAEPFGLFEVHQPPSQGATEGPLSYRITPLYQQLLSWDR